MTVTDFHRLVVELELESVLLTTRQFTELFGALNWRENSALELIANTAGQHPLKAVITGLAEWLDGYAQGTATAERWLEVMDDASRVQRLADISIHEAYNRDNPRWQAAKAVAATTPFTPTERL